MIELPAIVPAPWPPIYPYDVESGLAAHFDMQSGGSTLIDHSGRGNNAALVGPTYETGPLGLCLRFDGVDDIGTITGDVIGVGDVTVAAWVKLSSWGGGGLGRIIDNGKYQLYVQSASANLKLVSNTGGGAVSATSSLALSVWTHIVVVRRSTGKANIYITGVRSGTAEQDSAVPAAGTGNTVMGNRSAADRAFDGLFGDIKLYQRALTEVEAQELYRRDAWRFEVAG